MIVEVKAGILFNILSFLFATNDGPVFGKGIPIKPLLILTGTFAPA
jgi:hypothetical protein